MTRFQTAKPTDGKKKTFWQEVRRRVIITLILFAFYVLSIGPMYWNWYQSKHLGGSPGWAVVYEPLYVLCAACPPASQYVDAYILWWVLPTLPPVEELNQFEELPAINT